MTHEEYQLLVASVTPHLKGLVRPVVTETPKGLEYGTGQVLRVGETHVLLTAGHVVADYDSVARNVAYRIGVPQGLVVRPEQITWLDSPRRRAWTDTAHIRSVNEEGPVDVRHVDVAVVEVSAGEVAQLGLQVHPLTPPPEMPLPGGIFVMVVGCPTANYDVSDLTAPVAEKLAFGGVSAPVELWSEKWSPATHQALVWPDGELDVVKDGRVQQVRLPHPRGLSGCAFWMVPDVVDAAFFNPIASLRFVGIQYAYNDYRRLIVGCNALAVASLIGAVFPETAQALRDLGYRLQDVQLREREDG